jgi:transcriptional regulator with XRE-family HTH domain
MLKLTPSRIRKVRRTLGLSRNEFAHILWASLRTVAQWECGERVPVGMHHRLLLLLEEALANPSVQPRLLEVRASDPMLLLYRLLEPLYGSSAKHS